MKSIAKANDAIAKFLGVDVSTKDVAGVTLRLRPGSLPTLVVHRYLFPDSMDTKPCKFVLHPIEDAS